MTKDEQIEKISHLLEPLLTEDVFLVSIGIKPTNNIKVYLDADSGLGIEKCIRINRALYKSVEESGMYPEGDFSLEVSSPGVDEPLKLPRQYVKNTGREVEVTLLDQSIKTGKLIAVTNDSITLEFTEGKNKKAVTKQEIIPWGEILKTIVQIKF
ncbi:MAG TPA: ribosome maturation factor [Ferruginibacter sp.]|nr:ribosome maturation factor [Ferruginibacter sp.]HRN79064.1 ribosome maturation factor [Ferruginibacter sp.]HRO17020.1 ribosome maturation factor [Ferruginibacter sp.]HRQ20014.1 ribosome maturation factor [Ferruginibacter sp.]